MKRPGVSYPTLIKGRISGPIRCESLDGSELWLPKQDGILSIPPFERDGKTWCVSHIQKRATFFSLLYDPFIFHFGKYWHLQEQDERGNWKPGTERGIYWRTPGWRWQIPDAHSDLTPWIWSWGRAPGGHLD
jgi:hypothetical protein